MYTVMVQVVVPEAISEAALRTIFEQGAPGFVSLPGLVRKYYLVSDDRRTIGGCFLWKYKEDAERIFTDSWKQKVIEKYKSSEPLVTYFRTDLVVEAEQGFVDAFWQEPARS